MGRKSSDYYYRQPRYYSKFRCIGGECPESCCDGWQIDWLSNEYNKLKNADSSDELKRCIDESFEHITENDKDLYRIIMEYRIAFEDVENGESISKREYKCPFHNKETGLCNIQKELGEKYLGNVCTLYPRLITRRKNVLFRSCTLSCPAVIDLLYEDEDAVKLENYIARDISNINPMAITWDIDDIVKKHPIIEHRFAMTDFFSELLSNKKHSVEDSIILGSLAAKHLSDAAEKKEFSKIPQIMKELAPQLNADGASRPLADINPNYQLKFKLVNNTIVQFYSENSRLIDISILHDGNELIVERYIDGLNNFNSAFKDRPFVLRNIFTNLFYNLQMPLKHIDKTIFENYAYFVICCAMIKTIAAAAGYKNDDIAEDFKISVSEISRGIAHNSKKVTDVIDNMKEIGLTSPAHLALIIK